MGKHSAGAKLSTAQEKAVIAKNKKAKEKIERKVVLGLLEKFASGR